jgi:hypothetical protein
VIPLPWWALAVLMAVCWLLVAALIPIDRWLDRRLARQLVTAEAERYARNAAQQNRDAAELAAWQSLVQRLNDQSSH